MSLQAEMPGVILACYDIHHSMLAVLIVNLNIDIQMAVNDMEFQYVNGCCIVTLSNTSVNRHLPTPTAVKNSSWLVLIL